MGSSEEFVVTSDANSESHHLIGSTISQITTISIESLSSESNTTRGILSTQHNYDNDESKEEKKEEADERPAKKQKLDDTVDDDGALCVICYEVWDQTGEHRIASLKCGHLFGHKCILRWLTENKVCPTCKTKATKKDIRFIYANKLIAIDNGEITRMQAELEDSKTENSNLQLELTSVLCKLALVNAEVEKYKFQIQHLKSRPIIHEDVKLVEKSFNLKFKDSYMVCPQGSCRVMDCIISKSTVIASMKSGNSLFPGYGVKQFNSESFAALSYTPLHTKIIRDLKFNQMNARLLSVSLDKFFNIANIYSNETNIKQGCDDMLWSCCWDAVNPNIFYVGGQQGNVKQFDSRYITDTALAIHRVEGDFSPVVSIASMPLCPGSAMPQGGFIACKLNSIWAFENFNGTVKQSPIPIQGPFVSMTYHDEDKQLLVSARPNTSEPSARHMVCNLRKDAGVLTYERIHTFSTGKLQKTLSRSCFIQKEDCAYVATPSDAVIQLWNSKTGFPVTSGKTTGSVIDLLPLQNSNGAHLLALSEKKLSVFKLTN